MRKPEQIDPLAETILKALSDRPESGEIVLGGYLALQHYLEYRGTHDVDAWWKTRASTATEKAIRQVMQQIGARDGYELRERRFGDTLSFELSKAGKKRFSFQIAVRSVGLEPPVASPWPPVLLETLRDNIGAKMNALVDRGAPRDFTDIMRVVHAGLGGVSDCWDLWKRKNPGQAVEAAREKVAHHLSAIEMRRPLETISDPAERAQAEQTRDWFRREFLVPTP